MKLKDGFITHQTGDEQIMVSVGNVKFNGLVRSNATAAFIINALKKETTQEQIVDAMAAEYDAPRERIAQDVQAIIDKLREAGFLAE